MTSNKLSASQSLKHTYWGVLISNHVVLKPRSYSLLAFQSNCSKCNYFLESIIYYYTEAKACGGESELYTIITGSFKIYSLY